MRGVSAETSKRARSSAAGDRADLGVTYPCGLEGLGDERELRHQPRHADLLPRRSEPEANAVAQPVRAGQGALAGVAALRVKLTDLGDEAILTCLELRGEGCDPRAGPAGRILDDLDRGRVAGEPSRRLRGNADAPGVLDESAAVVELMVRDLEPDLSGRTAPSRARAWWTATVLRSSASSGGLALGVGDAAEAPAQGLEHRGGRARRQVRQEDY